MKYQLIHHTKGLVSDKINQKLLVSLFDVSAGSFSLTATMQALEAQEERKAAERSEEGKEWCYKHPGATAISSWISAASATEGMNGQTRGRGVRLRACACTHPCTEEERWQRSAPNAGPEGRSRARRAKLLSGSWLGKRCCNIKYLASKEISRQ